MKRIISLILVLSLVFAVVAEALAEPNWEITQQPKITMKEKKGKQLIGLLICLVICAAAFFYGDSRGFFSSFSSALGNIRFNEDAFPIGVAAYVSGAIGWLQSQAE